MLLPPLTAWECLGWAGLVVLMVVLVLAVRAYRIGRTRSFALLLAACVSLVIAHIGRVIVPFGAGLFFGHGTREQRLALFHFTDRAGMAFEFLAFLLLAAALFSFIREHSGNGTRTI